MSLDMPGVNIYLLHPSQRFLFFVFDYLCKTSIQYNDILCYCFHFKLGRALNFESTFGGEGERERQTERERKRETDGERGKERTLMSFISLLATHVDTGKRNDMTLITTTHYLAHQQHKTSKKWLR